MAQIKGFTVELDGNTTKLQKALKQCSAPVNELKGKLKQVENAMKFDKYNPQLIAQKQKYLNEAIDETKAKLKNLKAMQEQASTAMKNGVDGAEDAYDRLEREIAQCNAQLKTLAAESASASGLGVMSARLTDTGNKFSAIGQKMQGVTIALGVVGAASVSSAVSFDSAFTGVEKTVDATDEQIAELRQGILDMSKEIPASVEEISAVAEAAGQLGIDTDNILGFTEVMIGLGEATNLSAEEAAMALAQFANITGMAQTDFDRLGSVIVDLGNNFATTEADIVNMGQRLASSGTLVGLTEPQIMGLATAMASVGVEAEAGGTAMSQTLTQIGKAVSSGGADLQKFASVAGMSADEFASAWENDPMTAIQAFIDGLGNIDESGGNLDQTLSDLGMSGIRQSDMLKRLALNSEDVAKAVNTANDAWKDNIALDAETQKRYDSLASQIQIAKNNLTVLGISIGETLAPIVVAVAEWLAKLAEKFDGLSSKTKKFIAITGLIVAAIGPVMSVLGFMFSGMGSFIKVLTKFPKVITVVGKAFKVFGTLMKGVFGILTANPAGLVITAIIALAGALLYLYNHCEGFRDAVNALWDKIKEKFSAFIDAVKDAWESFKEKLTEVWQAIEPIVSDVFERIKNVVQGFIDYFSGIIGIISGVFEIIVGLVTGNVDLIQAGWEKLKNGVKTAFDGIFTIISNVFSNVFGVIQSIGGSIVSAGQSIVGKFKGAFDKTREITGKISSALGSALDTAKGFISSFTSIGADIMSGIAKGIANNISKCIDAIGGACSKIVTAGKKALGINSPSKVFRKVVGYSIPEGIAAGIEEKSKLATKSVATLCDDMTNAASVASTVEYGSYAGQMKNNANNSDKISQLTNLLNQYLPSLLNASNKAIYLDGKKLVGGTVDEMNKQLGTISARQGRCLIV